MRSLMKCLPLLSVALFPALIIPVAEAQQSSSAGSTVQSFSQAELDSMLAPVALYPDTVLSHLLIAATYPLEIIKANRWVEDNPGLTAEQALDRVEDKDWDPSVKALVPFPQLLQRMSEDIDWTQRVGDAFLGQEAQVMTSIQTLRNKAYASGNLEKQQHIKVVREEKTIIIEPASPQVVYIPYYDPLVVYGTWWWHSYQPVYWHVPVGYRVHRGFSWGVGIQIAPGFYFSSFHWPRRQIVVIDHHYHRRDPYYYRSHQIVHHKKSHHWRHNPHHRRGVSYQAGYQPTREFSGNRSYQNKEQQREWAAQTRENKGYAPERKFNHEKDQRFANKERQFERKNADDATRRSKEEGPRLRTEPTNSGELKDRDQVVRQELLKNRQDLRSERALQKPEQDVLRSERVYQTPRPERPNPERAVQQPKQEVARPNWDQQPRREQPRIEQPRIEQPRAEQRSYQTPRVEQPRVEQRSYQTPRVEQPRAEQRSYQTPRVEQPRAEQRSYQAPRVEQPRAQSREMRGGDNRPQNE